MNETHPILINLGKELNQIVVGQSHLIKQLLIAMLAGGHVILEGVPGTGKTLLVKVLAQLIQADYRRVQLTPDVLPSDITGTNIFDLNSRNFTLKKGPVFTEMLLADEINRTPPKTQAALLEAMEEMQVTLDGESLPLPDLFWVIATQNPLEFEGTYPLPEAQLDRFLFKLVVDYPDQAAEKQMLLNRQAGFAARRLDIAKLKPIATVAEILQARQAVKQVKVSEAIVDYLLEIVIKSRQYPDLALGASPRAAGAWLQTSQAAAWINGRDFVTPDDVKSVASPLLRHRLLLKPEAMLDGLQIDAIISSVINQVPVPR
ncbi:MoxR family ATPase [Cronbergia sp. UHCC 0137]|uniref:AAA family ATPase n=1 Tax=Cronbergia sp. UHCC 0137 TaxID=3110239 RepID=UPI002B21E7E1|nr:MoxR family ATPase [Cronbergia sp. UHCC 0137]MEA5619697.1 MoxR family ATPase [Cronbergia sp. UHCC 0137]